MHNENWDDLRYLLTVAETGSVLAAAKVLGVNHATVLRHVAAFEERHGQPVFERTVRGYRLLPDQAHVVAAAQRAEAAIREVTRLARGGAVAQRMPVRLSSTDTLCACVLPGFVEVAASAMSEISITLLSSNRHVDLAREEVEIILRPAVSLPDGLVGKVVADLGFAAYAAEPASARWLGLTGALSRSVAAQAMADRVSPDEIWIASDSFLTLREMAAGGQGIAILPCFVGDPDSRLTRRDDLLPPLSVPIWVAQPSETVVPQYLKRVIDLLEAFMTTRRAVLLGA